MDAPMDDAAMEEYADLLVSLEKTNPERYTQFLDIMQSQSQAEGLGPDGPMSSPQDNADATLFDMLRSSTGERIGAANTSSLGLMFLQAVKETCNAYAMSILVMRLKLLDFAPQFPGDKIMGKDGLQATPEGMHIDVKPGFVIKTIDVKNKKKTFVNVVYADNIQEFSGKKKLDDEGKEQEGIHVPLSLGVPHEVKDKNGASALAFDVAVNTKVVEDCRADKTGAFRNFVCELAIEYIDQKYQIKLDDRYKLPRLTYRGELPPPRHYIRKTQMPLIQEVSAHMAIESTKTTKAKAAPSKRAKTAAATYDIYEERNKHRIKCTRLSSILKGSTPLSPQVLEQAMDQLVVSIQFPNKIQALNDIRLELHAELLTVKAPTHHDLDIFLPYPVVLSSASVCFAPSRNTLEMTLIVDKSWNSIGPDCGSAPWLLARALDKDREVQNGNNKEKTADCDSNRPKSLVEMFHLVRARESTDGATGNRRASTVTPRWDPVLEDEVLPEDRFHRKDMMSMHILEQRRVEREQKAKDAEDKRKQRRTEVESMQKKATEAGKTWREMYPNEPETTYIDVEDIVREEKERFDRHLEKQNKAKGPTIECMPTEDAIRAAAKWTESGANRNLNLQSALAFDLL